MSFPTTIRNFNVFVDGISYFGRATKAKTPNLTLITQKHRGAGMDGEVAIDVGANLTEVELEFAEYDPAILATIGNVLSLTVRPVAQSQDGGTIVSHIETCYGLVTAIEKDTLEGGKLIPLKLKMDCRRFTHEVDGKVIHEIDLELGTRIINGTDQTKEIRKAMGI